MTIPTQDLHINIGWLAGIIDGEGSVVSYHSPSQSNFFHIRIYIVNTDIDIIEQSLIILSALGIVAYTNQKSASKKQREGSFSFTKPCWEIIIAQRDSVRKLIPIILPYIVSYKKEKLEKAQIYLQENPFNAGRKSGRTTERLAPNTNLKRFRMKLQSALNGNVKKTAEMTVSS